MSKQPTSTTKQHANAISTLLEHKLRAVIHVNLTLNELKVKND
ncbi:hypothetical protein MTCD1_03065 [Colwellia marinimaniae]|uniref:Uncharacterized protein n=1 Tax=Colwellia marinimaniae TaxID=1513592 RepID=A0ABQ0MYN5_9GAMM|nr:hypothetical protein MTCD1_03065 [Colwellia marinimaniae]